jgi:hypothetical protein
MPTVLIFPTPQGCNLGPILFKIFINAIQSGFGNSKSYLFADDVKIFRKIDGPEDGLLLQEDINRLAGGCDVNGMTLIRNCE